MWRIPFKRASFREEGVFIGVDIFLIQFCVPENKLFEPKG
jgi:hypothetical protein